MGETKTERFTGQDPSKGVNREPLKFNLAALNWEFLRVVAEICPYAAAKYGSVEQYADIRPEGEQSPVNHILAHAGQYIAQTPHDKFGDVKYHLAAIAYNAMMEYYYLTHGGPTTTDKLYREDEEFPVIQGDIQFNPATHGTDLKPGSVVPLKTIEEPSLIQQGKEKLTTFFSRGSDGRKREGTISETGN